MKIKDRDKDGRISRMRCPGLDKARFQVGAFAIVRNLKRLVVLGVEPIPIA